jgi:hypothetical protein
MHSLNCKVTFLWRRSDRDPSRYLEDCETWAYISCMLVRIPDDGDHLFRADRNQLINFIGMPVLVRGLLPVLALLLMFVPPTLGQRPKRVEKCLPYPTLAQEIRDMQPPLPYHHVLRCILIRVEFDSNDGIPADAREEISTELRSHVFERDANTVDLSDLANEIAKVGQNTFSSAEGLKPHTCLQEARLLFGSGSSSCKPLR